VPNEACPLHGGLRGDVLDVQLSSGNHRFGMTTAPELINRLGEQVRVDGQRRRYLRVAHIFGNGEGSDRGGDLRRRRYATSPGRFRAVAVRADAANTPRTMAN